MDRFASCYFCGEAFDASLSEYPVVPEALQSPDEGPTVVLCGTCRRKLGAVVEEVVDAGQGEPVTDAARNGRRDPPATNGAEPAESSNGSLLEDGPAASESDDATATAAEAWESPVSDDEAADSANQTGDESDGTSRADGESDGASQADGESATDDEPTLTKLEYNKVMRLLQNRPFPVDRGEIREVATSAYDIDPAEFDAVVEAAVERELIAVENGQFVEPA